MTEVFQKVNDVNDNAQESIRACSNCLCQNKASVAGSAKVVSKR